MNKILALAITFFLVASAEAQSNSALARAIRCSRVVVDTKSGTYVETPQKKPRFVCFTNISDAKRAGFLDPKVAERINLTGWYQLRLRKMVINTCDVDPSNSGPVLFFQLKDARDGVFGQFCPSFGTYTGFRDAAGFTMSGEELANENPSNSICDDGKIRIQRFVRLTRTGKAAGKPTFSAEYREVISCQSESSGASVCQREYAGTAHPETHSIWPAVPANILQLTAGCSQALTTCETCHPGIDFSGLRP